MKLRFIGKEKVNEGAYSFIFQPEQLISWQPGQYLHYVLPHPNTDDRGVERWFTISTAPFEGKIQITTRLDGQTVSSFKKALMQLTQGQEIEADGPKGKFILREGDVKHALIAGGIGITPYRSMLAQLAHDNKPANADLLYANRDNNFVFGDELEAIAVKDPTLKIIKFVDKKLTEADLQAYVDEPRSAFYLSGPHGMVESYENLLKSMGVSEDNIMTDYFPGY